MIRGYVSSDEDDYDDYDFGYSEPLFVQKNPPLLPEIQTPEVKEKLYLALEETQKIELYLKAVEEGDLETVEKFISEGLPTDSADSQGWTALMSACGKGHFEVVQLLLNNGADPNKHKELFTPLMTCCTDTLVPEDLKLNCVRLLLEHGAQVNAKDKYRTTALMYASGSGYENIVNELLESPEIDVSICDKDGWTALFHAINNNKINIVKKLMSVDTNLDIKDRYERTPLSLALDRNLHELAKILGYVEKKPPEVKKQKKLRRTLLKHLPDSEGQGGFSGDSKTFLLAFNLTEVDKISFPDLLNATEMDLYKIGIKLQYDRLKLISEGIHQYHLQPWKTSSMQKIKWKVPLSLEEMINIAASLAKHLTIANASLRYVGTRISSRQSKESLDLGLEKETIIYLIHSYETVEKIKALLQKISKNILKIKPEVQGDFIHPFKHESDRQRKVKLFWHAIGAATVGFLIFYYKSTPHFKTLTRFPSYTFTSLIELFQTEPINNFWEFEQMQLEQPNFT